MFATFYIGRVGALNFSIPFLLFANSVYTDELQSVRLPITPAVQHKLIPKNAKRKRVGKIDKNK